MMTTVDSNVSFKHAESRYDVLTIKMTTVCNDAYDSEPDLLIVHCAQYKDGQK